MMPTRPATPRRTTPPPAGDGGVVRPESDVDRLAAAVAMLADGVAGVAAALARWVEQQGRAPRE